MSTTDSQPIERPSQFQLRHVGIVVVVMAITLAIAAPWLRQWTLPEWLVLLHYAGCIGIGVVIYLVVHERRQFTLRRQAGLVLIAVRSPTAKYADIAKCVLGALVIAILFANGMAQVHLQVKGPPGDFMFWFLLSCAVPMQLAYSASFLLRRSAGTLFCENGLLLDSHLFLPWEHLQRWNWSSAAQDKLLIYSKNMQVGAFTVPPDRREEVEAILHAQLSNRDADS